MMKKKGAIKNKVFNWRCDDFSSAPFFDPHLISCKYGKPGQEQTYLILEKETGKIKIFNPKICKDEKNGFFICDSVPIYE